MSCIKVVKRTKIYQLSTNTLNIHFAKEAAIEIKSFVPLVHPAQESVFVHFAFINNVEL